MNKAACAAVWKDGRTMVRVKAFSLVELLVVIAVISVLAALLLPTLDKSLDVARRMACQNIQHQVFISVLNYAQDFQGCPATGFPSSQSENASMYRAGTLAPSGVPYGTGTYLLIAKCGYAPKELFECPAMDYRLSAATGWVFNNLHYSYRYNESGRATGLSYNHGGLIEGNNRLFDEARAKRWLLTDAIESRVDASGVPYTATTGQFSVKWAHGEGGNILQHSGAVIWVPNNIARAWPTAQINGGKYTNPDIDATLMP